MRIPCAVNSTRDAAHHVHLEVLHSGAAAMCVSLPTLLLQVLREPPGSSRGLASLVLYRCAATEWRIPPCTGVPPAPDGGVFEEMYLFSAETGSWDSATINLTVLNEQATFPQQP